MNYKEIGEIGQNCVIGDLAKYGLQVAILLSDNLPFDFIVIAEQKLFKIQVKTSAKNKNGEYIAFGIKSNNWLQGTTKKYTDKDCDVIICYDLAKHNSFLLLPEHFKNKGYFTIRYKKAKTRCQYKSNWYEDYILSDKRVKEVFNFDVPNLDVHFSTGKKKYTKICQNCGDSFEGNYRNAKYCSIKCKGEQRRKVKRVSKEELIELIKTKPMVQIGKQFGITDNAIRKWAIGYDIDIKKVKASIV